MEEMNITTCENVEEELETMEPIDEETEKTGLGTIPAMLIGSGITLAAIVGVKKLKQIWPRLKARREKSKNPVEAEVVEVSDDTETENDD